MKQTKAELKMMCARRHAIMQCKVLFSILADEGVISDGVGMRNFRNGIRILDERIHLIGRKDKK